MNRYKIMVIEDDPVIQGELRALLEGNGYVTAGAEDFSSVIETVKKEKPHLILLDKTGCHRFEKFYQNETSARVHTMNKKLYWKNRHSCLQISCVCLPLLFFL